MGFDKEPDFNIHLDGEVFFNHHPLFDEVFDKSIKQRIFEDIMDIGQEEDFKFSNNSISLLNSQEVNR